MSFLYTYFLFISFRLSQYIAFWCCFFLPLSKLDALDWLVMSVILGTSAAKLIFSRFIYNIFYLPAEQSPNFEKIGRRKGLSSSPAVICKVVFALRSTRFFRKTSGNGTYYGWTYVCEKSSRCYIWNVQPSLEVRVGAGLGPLFEFIFCITAAVY